MTRYRTKRDMPLVKAGTEVYSINYDCDYTFRKITIGRDDYQLRIYVGTYDDIVKLIDEGWIEEIKPREWWVLKPKDGVDNKARLYQSAGQAGDDYQKEAGSGWFEIIKVREVLDET